MSDIEPAEVFPLASYLWEEMQARGWTTDDVAKRMGDADEKGLTVNLGTLAILMSVQKDNCLLDDLTVSKLAHAFDVSAELFRNLDTTWRKWPDRRAPFECPDDAYGPLTVSAMRLVPSSSTPK